MIWESVPPLLIARSHPSAAAVGGKIYVFGGGGPGFSSLDSVECYDPALKRWEKAAPMPTKRSGTVALAVREKIWVMGGGFKQPDGTFKFFNLVEIYDPASDRWEIGSPLVHPHDYPAAVIAGERIFLFGGHHPDAKGGPQSDPGFDVAELYDPALGRWRVIAPLPTPRFALAGAVLEGSVLAMGGVAFTPQGFHDLDIVERLDLQRETWERDPRLKLPWPVAAHSVAFYRGGIYLFGGFGPEGIWARSASFDPVRGRWEEIASMATARAATAAVASDEGIYVIGGWAKDGRVPLADVALLIA